MDECDICCVEGADVVVCSPRPSDPHEIVCVMMAHTVCSGPPLTTVDELVHHFRDGGGGTVGATREAWSLFFEDENENSAAEQFGFWFLSI